MTRILLGVILIAASIGVAAQGPRVAMSFTPQTENPNFEAAAVAYRRIWAEEGERVIRAMEQVTRLEFPDLWVELYGQEFADRHVAWERALKGLYDYDAAWTWALAMAPEQRAAMFADVVKATGKGR